jgi:uncharacterized membrane protein
MASTRPTSEQLRFTSSKTGEHSLDTYMEDAEIGNVTLANLLSQAFDASGQFKTGFADYKGDFATSTLYDIGDVYREASSQDLYVVRVQHTSTNVAADLAANKTALILDASAVETFSTSASNSATASANSATASAASAASAATANTNAQTAKTAAETAQAAAETAKTAAETALDNFEDTYLGAFASDPTTDGDGDALTAGDLYFSTATNQLKVYNGTSWQAAALDANTVVPQTSGTGAAELPTGTTAQRDGSPSAGYLRFNTTDTAFEGFDGSAWGAIGGGGPALDGGGTGEESVIRLNKNQISGNVALTIATGDNGMSAGPITITAGSSVTVSAGAAWHIVGT